MSCPWTFDGNSYPHDQNNLPGQPVPYMRSTNSKPQLSNQFPINKIKPCPLAVNVFIVHQLKKKIVPKVIPLCRNH